MDEPGVGVAESAGVSIEAGEVGLVVDMEPFAPRGLRVLYGATYDLGADAMALAITSCLRVDQERVVASVPGNVHEAHQHAVGVACGDPPERVRPHLVPPSGDAGASMRTDQVDHLVIGERAAPCVEHVFGHEGRIARLPMPVPINAGSRFMSGRASAGNEIGFYARGVVHPFRFGLQVFSAPSRREWQDQARRAEALGFDSILVPDHVLTPGPLAPIAALDALAEVTTRISIGTLVLNNDLRHPALVARDAATLDLLSDGRFELGIGAGHAEPEYTEIGIPFESAATRVARLEASVQILRQLFDGNTVTTDGPHYRLRDHALFPSRRVRLLVGGNGNDVLRIAAKHADIVGFTGLGRTLADGQRHEARWSVEDIDAKVAQVRRAAAPRIADLEFNVLVQEVQITDNRDAAITEIAQRVDADPKMIHEAPFLLIGSTAQIVEQLHAARERWGFSYFVSRTPDATATIIEALRSGR